MTWSLGLVPVLAQSAVALFLLATFFIGFGPFLTESTGTPYVKLDSEARVLHFSYSLDALWKSQFKGCHLEVEALMNLRPIKTRSVIERADARILKETSALASVCMFPSYDPLSTTHGSQK